MSHLVFLTHPHDTHLTACNHVTIYQYEAFEQQFTLCLSGEVANKAPTEKLLRLVVVPMTLG